MKSPLQIDSLFTRLHKHLLETGLLSKGDRLALAVSGGLDSVAMLDLFCRLRETLKLGLVVFHINHGLRKQAATDEDFVLHLAKSYGCDFYSKEVATHNHRRQYKLSTEEAARDLRYRAFEQMSVETGCSTVATAHTMNDQAETVLDRLMRGSGVLGMAGMRPRRGRYIRPMLIFLRDELEDYVTEKALVYRQDETNRDLLFRRNRIRQKLIPLLQEDFNPAMISTLKRASEVFSEVEDFLTAHTEQLFGSLVTLQKKNQIVLEINRFLSYFRTIQKYVLFKALEQFSLSRSALQYDLLNSILNAINRRQIGKYFEIDGRIELLVDHDGIVLQKKEVFRNADQRITVTGSDECEFGKHLFKWEILDPADHANFNSDSTMELFDFHEVGGDLHFRTFLPGDRFMPLNLGGHKKVADYFSDKKVPLRLRQATPILESLRGIVWVCGYCIDDRFKVTDQTQKVLKMEVRSTARAS